MKAEHDGPHIVSGRMRIDDLMGEDGLEGVESREGDGCFPLLFDCLSLLFDCLPLLFNGLSLLLVACTFWWFVQTISRTRKKPA